jgi:hypothetical protein
MHHARVRERPTDDQLRLRAAFLSSARSTPMISATTSLLPEDTNMLYLSELHAEFVDEYGWDPAGPGPDADAVREAGDGTGRRRVATAGVRRWHTRVGRRLRYAPSRTV